jgi:phosphoglycolate phosphatase-like HAD superfamily hydrolase
VKASRLVVFDFDGTLADSFAACLAVGNQLADEYRFRPIERAEVDELRDLTWQQLRRRLGIPLWRIPGMLARGNRLLHHQQQEVSPVAGITSALAALPEDGTELGILTSASVDRVERFLRSQQLDRFSFVAGSTSLWGKARRLRRLRKQHGLDAGALLYIGDETRDVEAAQRAGVACLAVSWGFNSAAALTRCQPDWLIHQPRELPVAIEAFVHGDYTSRAAGAPRARRRAALSESSSHQPNAFRASQIERSFYARPGKSP